MASQTNQSAPSEQILVRKKAKYRDIRDYRRLTDITDVPGRYIECVSERKTPFIEGQYWIFFFLIVPFIFLPLFIILVIQWWWKRLTGRRVLVFDKGFIVQKVGFNGKPKDEQVFHFSIIKGLTTQKTLVYNRVYGIPVYSGTTAELDAVFNDNDVLIALKGVYRNKHDNPKKHSFISDAINAIYHSRYNFRMKEIRAQFERSGTATFFIPGHGDIRFGKDYLSIGGRTFRKDLTTCNVIEGVLQLIPIDPRTGSAIGMGIVSVDLRDVYDYPVFMAILRLALNLRP